MPRHKQEPVNPEWLAKHQDALEELDRQEGSDEDDVRPGRSPAVEEERNAIADKAAALLEDSKSTVLERRVLLLEEELRIQAEMVSKMMKGAGAQSIEEVVDNALDDAEDRDWSRWCSRVRDAAERAGLKRNQAHVVIQIHSTGDVAKDFPVPVVLNGAKYVIPRGKAFRVPIGVCEILGQAKVRLAVPRVDDKGNVYDEIVSRHQFPFTVVSASVALPGDVTTVKVAA